MRLLQKRDMRLWLILFHSSFALPSHASQQKEAASSLPPLSQKMYHRELAARTTRLKLRLAGRREHRAERMYAAYQQEAHELQQQGD